MNIWIGVENVKTHDSWMMRLHSGNSLNPEGETNDYVISKIVNGDMITVKVG
jgi:hypothetical protein